jgi:hypothetical protein
VDIGDNACHRPLFRYNESLLHLKLCKVDNDNDGDDNDSDNDNNGIEDDDDDICPVMWN